MHSRATAVCLLREQKQRREFSLFASAIETPLTLDQSTPIVLPGNGTLYVEAVPSTVATRLFLITGGGRAVGAPALSAGSLHNVGYFPQGELLLIHPTYDLGLRLYVRDGVGNRRLFAEG